MYTATPIVLQYRYRRRESGAQDVEGRTTFPAIASAPAPSNASRRYVDENYVNYVAAASDPADAVVCGHVRRKSGFMRRPLFVS